MSDFKILKTNRSTEDPATLLPRKATCYQDYKRLWNENFLTLIVILISTLNNVINLPFQVRE